MSAMIALSFCATLAVASAGRLPRGLILKRPRAQESMLNAQDHVEFSPNDMDYIDEIKALYVPASYQSRRSQRRAIRYAHSPFHNLDHANNIEEFAAWYAKKAGISGKDRKLLVLSAISHDVMHPGGDNNEGAVTKAFLPLVYSLFPETDQHALAWFAGEVWNELSSWGVTVAQMRLALGAMHAKSNAEVPTLLVERAAQEVVHAWVALQYIRKHNIELDLSKFVINILMTSITLHYKIRFAGAPSTEKDYVNSMCEDSFFRTFSCGMLLHLLDMGWSTQSWCVKEGGCKKTMQTYNKLPGLFFGPRFLAESKRYKQVNANGEIKPITSLEQVWMAECDFLDMVVAFVENLQHTKIFFEDRKDIPAALIASARFQKGVVKSPEFAQEVREVVSYLHTISPQEYDKMGPFFEAA